MTWDKIENDSDGWYMVKYQAPLDKFSIFSIEQEQPITTGEWEVYLECTADKDSFAALYVAGLTLEAAKKYCEGIKKLRDNLQIDKNRSK